MDRAIKYLLFLFFLFSSFTMFSQYQKEIIFLRFKENTEEKEPYYRGIKFYSENEKGIVFNLLTEGSLLFGDHKKSDTLSICQLKDYPITSIEGVEQKVKDFRYKTYKKSPPDENDKAYQFYNKNDIFETYLIEILNNDKFVVYPVHWRNQNVID